MTALGWTLFFVVYFIGVAGTTAQDMQVPRITNVLWRWKWRALLWPIGILDYVFEHHAAISDSLWPRRKS